ncbi:GntR family transcriptional regulator [Brevibacillus choshinensis]|uniref:GntR family transcriptional regulator n=1 Tax=Brevibacillus choshinensis TaxID=54911 RepID=A0ABX7FSG5_BRECH|nr:GntR family transcriptional regulator [Brevibacillus choshinensis]QRG69041.1 GntR family transcriptional regulator [Brevibacillus choshinensis]
MSRKFELRLESHELDTLHIKVCRVLREAILRGHFQPGERLVQEELASSLGVSRMPVREALRKLETEGLVIIEPHRGAIVKSLSVEDIQEIYGLRAQFEKMAVEMSAAHMSQADIDQLEELVVAMEKSSDSTEFIESNIEFHRLLISRCTWKRLVSFIETLWNGFPQQTPQMLNDQTEKSNKEHRDILQAIKNGNAAEAGRLVHGHIRRTGENLVKSLQDTLE